MEAVSPVVIEKMTEQSSVLLKSDLEMIPVTS